MTAEEQAQWIAEIVEVALEREPAELPSFLQEACGDDAALRHEVESLLGYQKEATDFIERPAYEANATLLAGEDRAEKIGEILGQYKIISLLGEGGMGEVYLAEDAQLGRHVAIKLVKAGFGRASLVRHFQREERILAALTHPNIARLYGGGITPDGIPFFVMEYVEGERVDVYCDRHALNFRDRLQLFRKICSAVAYAHQHLVIHRDLKPSNIRVTPEGEPKLLDFGIARLLEDETTSVTEQTMTLAGVMTPDYASPEQVRGEAMTTASDVYSLGVILYELVTGTKPYRTKSRRLDEISRAITEQEPPRPSTSIAKGSPQSAIRNPKSLRGDLDNIVLKTMRKEPARRYASVGQFSEDIRRHLEGLPVIARKDTIAYRTSKFVARNRIAVAAAILIALAILAGLIVSLWEAGNARRQRDVAQRERSKAERINKFLQDMLGSAAPEVRGIDIRVSDVLGEAVRRAKDDAVNQPDVMADVLLTLGRTYVSLGQYPAAEDTLRAALGASLKANGEANLTTARIMAWLGLTLPFQNKPAEGETFARKAVELLPKSPSSTPEDLGVALYGVGLGLIGESEPKAAQPFLHDAADVLKKYLGEKHGYYMASIVMLAKAHEGSGDRDGAEALYRQAITIGQNTEYRFRIYLAQAAAFLGSMLSSKGNYVEAEQTLRLSEAVYREQMGDSTMSVGAVLQYLGNVYLAQGDYAKAEAELRKSQEILAKTLNREHPSTLTSTALLGLSLSRAGKAAEGEPYLREALTMRRKILAPNDYLIPLTESALGECLTIQKRYEEAEPLLTHGYEGLKSLLGDQDRRVIGARQCLAKLYEEWGKPDKASRYR
ncbi:MAG: hypothetical protein DLM73_09100 [Chthoniobacterales bacterium]|nr:MAG: hypothetical protein DLM73_09100 [Chthoniobacterales bacterium]